MAGHRLLALLAAALVAGVVGWALTSLPGAPAPCLPADCDCATAGPGPIRQPANAWSSLALAAAGIATLVVSPGFAGGDPPAGRRGGEEQRSLPGEAHRRRSSHAKGVIITRSIAGGALVTAGLAAFLYHAGLTGWGARLDGIAVVVLVGTLALHGLTRTRAHCLFRLRSAGAQAAEQRSAECEPAAGHVRTLAPRFLLILGGLCWWLGQSGGPWCRPDSLLPAHAAWHLLAAGALGLWLGAEKTPRSGPLTRPPSTLRAERPNTR
jgi:hypothetical protein